jgi:hypothetical protein
VLKKDTKITKTEIKNEKVTKQEINRGEKMELEKG